MSADEELEHLRAENAKLKARADAPAPQKTTLTGRIGDRLDKLEHDADDGWTNKIFGCCKQPETCVVSTFAPCLTIKNVHARRDGGDGKKAGWCSCVLCGLGAWCGLCFCALGPYECISRRRTRKRLGRPGNCATDVACSCCCLPCTLNQELTELETAVGAGEVDVDERGRILRRRKDDDAVAAAEPVAATAAAAAHDALP